MPQISSTKKFQFTETAPTPLLEDFDAFTQYLEANIFALGKAKEFIPYKHLAALNEEMTPPNLENTPRTSQEFYPQLHLYYHLALAGKLFRKSYNKNQFTLEATERLAAYRAFSAAEKYFSLLETLWIDCSWKELGNQRRSFTLTHEVNNFLEALSKCKPEAPLFAKDGPDVLRRLDFSMPRAIVQGFAFFGWYELERDENLYQRLGSKEYYPVARITPSALGVVLTGILLRHRPYDDWNLAALRSVGFLPTMKEFKKKGKPDFVGLFRPLCAADELRSALPREIPQEIRGNFVFKVNLGPSVWRLIALSSQHTLHDLHAAIQKAFDFDSDHLYAFYMDNRWYSEERFESPHSSEGISADEVTIGELGLAVNQSFIYHFDFGDDWRFDVILLEIKTGEPLLKKPQIVEAHGKAPAQYRQEDW